MQAKRERFFPDRYPIGNLAVALSFNLRFGSFSFLHFALQLRLDLAQQRQISDAVERNVRRNLRVFFHILDHRLAHRLLDVALGVEDLLDDLVAIGGERISASH